MGRKKKVTYAQAGVRYDAMDPLKKLAQLRAKATATNFDGYSTEITASRGESAFVWEEKDAFRASVIEGLGTKNLVADAMREITGKTYYDAIAQDTVAMIINDLIVVGASPQVINAYFAAGDASWFADEARMTDLINGWGHACDIAGVVWGGGETPTLKGIIDPKTIDLAGSAIGIINPKSRLTLGDKLQTGDRIIFLESSGIHANGLTLARAVAERLPKGYATKLPNGEMYGEALLTPTHIYAKLVTELFNNEIDVHYMVNITGHGWRKLMRANKDITYVIDNMPEPQEEFALIQEVSGCSDEEMYGNFNMGAGFAIFVSEKDARRVQEVAGNHQIKSLNAGYILNEKQLIIKPKKITFTGKSLDLR
jgi:phosphoribosylformylglycinamidine cyclo-ligase